MKQKKQTIVRILALCLLTVLWAVGVAGVSFANAPAPAKDITVAPRHLPEEAVYLDLLIPMTQEDPYYCELNEKQAERCGFTRETPIVSYRDTDGYISYTFHMQQASSYMRPQSSGYSSEDAEPFYYTSFGRGAYAGVQTHLEYIQEEFGSVKAALLDEAGNVLRVSDVASVQPERRGYLAGTIAYDCETGELSPYFAGEGSALVYSAAILALMVLVLVVCAAATAAVETLVSLPFAVGPWKTVCLVNLVSNVVFNLLLLIGVAVFQIPYLLLLLFGELLAVVAEYRIFCRLWRNRSRRRIGGFVLTANLVSFLLVYAVIG